MVTDEALQLLDSLSKDDAALAEQVADLRRRHAEQSAAAAWAAVERPLGALLLASGLLGGITAMTFGILGRTQPELLSPTIKFSGWTAVCVVVAVVGLMAFRKVDHPAKIVSTQTFGVWVFVALAGVLTQIVGSMLGLGPYALIPVTSLLIGVGIATLAFQTRRWLLAPALACFAVSLILAAFPAYNREILGGMLVVALGGTGLSFCLGAPLDSAS